MVVNETRMGQALYRMYREVATTGPFGHDRGILAGVPMGGTAIMQKRKTVEITRWGVGALLLILALHAPAWGHTETMPFEPGEKLEYVLRWENVPAGSAQLEVLPLTAVNGEQAYHFTMTVRSNAFIDLFYKVRDRIDAFADVSMTRSLHYQKDQREGSHRRDEVIVFDWENNQAQYSNYGDKKDPIELMEGSFDPLSAFYFTRMAMFESGHEIQRPITDGKKNVIGRVTVLGRETITLQNGRTYDTYRVVPDLSHVGGVFKESPDATLEIWITADERRLPVRIRSKVVIGHFIGELVSVESTAIR